MVSPEERRRTLSVTLSPAATLSKFVTVIVVLFGPLAVPLTAVVCVFSVASDFVNELCASAGVSAAIEAPSTALPVVCVESQNNSTERLLPA